MFWLKSCPKCVGDLYEASDHQGNYVSCIQCGHYLGEAEEARLKILSQGAGTPPDALWLTEEMAA